MLFAVICTDKPGHQDVRIANRTDHVAYLGANKEIVKAAGPFLNDDGGMIGSLLIVETADRAALETFLTNDPYAKAGLFENVDIRNWKWTVNAPA